MIQRSWDFARSGKEYGDLIINIGTCEASDGREPVNRAPGIESHIVLAIGLSGLSYMSCSKMRSFFQQSDQWAIGQMKPYL